MATSGTSQRTAMPGENHCCFPPLHAEDNHCELPGQPREEKGDLEEKELGEFFFFLIFLRAAPRAYGSSQARD